MLSLAQNKAKPQVNAARCWLLTEEDGPAFMAPFRKFAAQKRWPAHAWAYHVRIFTRAIQPGSPYAHLSWMPELIHVCQRAMWEAMRHA